MDKNGICPHCGESWKGEDILEHLRRLDVNRFLTEKELLKSAALYGYTLEEKRNFANITIRQVVTEVTGNIEGGELFYECNKCHHVFDAFSDKHYESMFGARNNIIYESKVVEKDTQDEEEYDKDDENYGEYCGECGRPFNSEGYCSHCDIKGKEDGNKFNGDDENLVDDLPF